MITPPPPRGIECMLEALGAESRFRDSVLGDLAEEFSGRAERDGLDSADSWYRREALRVAPHLLWSWARRLRLRGVAHLVGVMVSSYVSLLLLGALVAATGYVVMRTLGLPTEYHIPWGNQLAASFLLAASLALGGLIGTLGGYISSWLGNEAPLANAIAFAVALGVVEIVVAVLAPRFPLWYRFAVPVVVVVAITVGGMLRVGQMQRDDDVAVPA
ncbi:MAG TPA: hypothetical protein VFS57_02525 [Gemmatimonadaceae bacterium]|nr:hypothetical protein [Gemmatimonadaceae bacterium]